jgi:hypothetical protein
MKRIATRVMESADLDVSRICPSSESPGRSGPSSVRHTPQSKTSMSNSTPSWSLRLRAIAQGMCGHGAKRRFSLRWYRNFEIRDTFVGSSLSIIIVTRITPSKPETLTRSSISPRLLGMEPGSMTKGQKKRHGVRRRCSANVHGWACHSSKGNKHIGWSEALSTSPTVKHHLTESPCHPQ